MSIIRNSGGQKIRVFAFDRTSNEPHTGGAAAMTCKVAKDWGTPTALTDTNPTETEDGYYLFDLTADETDAAVLDFYPESSTTNIQVVPLPATVYTQAFDVRDLEPVQHVWRFSRRSGGDIVASNVLNIAPGETIRAGFECAASIVLPAGAVLASMTAATPSSGDIIATKLGIDATQAKVSVVCDDEATAGETHYVRCEVNNSLGGGPVTLLGPVTVRAEPE